MNQVTLVPKTCHGKNAVHQHGKVWNVLESHNNQELLLESLELTFTSFGEPFTHDLRRVKKENDPNFKVVS